MGTQICCKCGTEKPLSEYYKKTKSRYSSRCKVCQGVLDRQRRDTSEYREYERLRAKRRQAADPEGRRCKGHEVYKRLRVGVLLKYGGRCVCCGEEHLEFLCIDHVCGGGTKHLSELGLGQFLRLLRDTPVSDDYRVLCRNCNQSLGYYGYCPHNRPETITQEASAWKRRYTALREETLALYGGRCQCCGEVHPEFLAIDHVRGNGATERKELTAERFLTKLIQFGEPHEDYRLLCHNCNSSLGYYGYCPHCEDKDVGLENLYRSEIKEEFVLPIP